MSAEDRKEAMKLIDQAVKDGARRNKACEILGISVRTLQRWDQRDGGADRRRGPLNGPVNRLSDDERQQIISTATQEEFQNLPLSQIVPKLADRGIYIASESTFYRTLRSVKLNTPRGKKSNNKHSRPTPLIATGPNEVWSWDITYCCSIVRGMFFYLYMILDVWSRKIVGWAVHECESNELASLLIREAVRREGVDPDQLILHSDNGGPMKGATMLATLQNLGVVPSFSRPSVSNDNPFSESAFSTMKTCPAYPDRPFESIEAVEDWVAEFVAWYNYEHLHSGIRFITPADRHHGNDRDILQYRQEVYQEAKKQNPSRWSRETRDWTPITTVYINPENWSRFLFSPSKNRRSK